jgi:ATP-dependent Clp protease ATP-binding subunit ClpC
MNRYSFNRAATRADKARLARLPLKPIVLALKYLILLSAAGAGVLWFGHQHQYISVIGLAIGLYILRTWLTQDIMNLKPALIGSSTKLENLLPAELMAGYRAELTAPDLWKLLTPTWQGRFLMIRFDLHPDLVAPAVASLQLDHDALWDEAIARAQAAGLTSLNTAAVMAALFHLSPALQNVLTGLKLELKDLDEGVAWVSRLDAYDHTARANYGGIARDWAAGFTPLLSQFGQNISHQIEAAGPRFGVQERTNQLDALITALGSANGSVVLVGDPGIGKTAILYGLADRILQGKQASGLAHHQVFSLNASMILSQQQHAGDLERIIMGLLGEAIHAGNIVLALDEAQLFFGQGTGAVNLSQVLLPVLQARNLKLVLAVTPGDWQKLKATNSALTSLLTPLVLVESNQTETIRLLADRALILEGGRVSTTYSALIEAYRLSGRYYQDEAYPGRALKVLEAAMNYPEAQHFITETSVQQVLESQLGVKVQQASATESDVLLHLEDRIHERMINQTRAVSVVAAALRRARAGVSNPKRPIGSFLFLGPTGVGKTELTRSLAALYFGSEKNMIRLDMSEYQQPSDVSRLLASAAENPESLLPKVRQQPFSVVLFDEIEKAHPNILNLFLQLLDEGQLTDAENKPASFKDAIVIATSNAGADKIRQHIEAGEELESFEQQFTDELISSGQFKPELLNRFDEIVLFRPLNQPELAQVVKLLISEVNRTLQPQKIQVQLTGPAITELVKTGYDPRLGARPMRRMVQRRVEDAVASQILRGQAKPGDTITLDLADVGGKPTDIPAPGETVPSADPVVANQPSAPSAGPSELPPGESTSLR